MENLTNDMFLISTLGSCKMQSPINGITFVPDDSRILYDTDAKNIQKKILAGEVPPSFEMAGPREKLFFDPATTKAAILTAGGICPGLNEVIKSLTTTLLKGYHVKEVYGIPYGYKGLNPEHGFLPVHLTLDMVDNIHEFGGTILGSSRGAEKPEVMVETLLGWGVNILFCIGGDGTAKGAHAIAEEIKRRHLPISVIAIPKTIDNDINFIDTSFGFATAVRMVGPVITCAHNEAKGALNGIGLIKVMGRDSGFIAATAALSNPFVNYCLVPEEKFSLTSGSNPLLPNLMQRLREKHHAVIIVSEGAGQEFFDNTTEQKDASGNKLHNDIGLFLKSEITEYFKQQGIPITIKYFDPSYTIRSVQAEGEDAVFCALLAQNAVHAAMAGKTDMMVGHWGNNFTHAPITLTTSSRKKIDLTSQLWYGLKAFLTF